MIKRILYLTMVVVLLSSCSSNEIIDPEPNAALETFLAKTSEGAYVNGQDVLIFNEAVHQLAINPTALTYRIQNDAQTVYMNAKLSVKPESNGELVVVTVSSRGLSGLSSSYNMTLEKSSSGKIWLWNDKASTGIIVNL